MARKRVVQLYRGSKRNYEICLVMHQRLSEEELSKRVAALKVVVESCGEIDNPEVVDIAKTKIRSFSYPIANNGNSKGYYVCFYTKASATHVSLVRKKLSLENDVLRVVVILAKPSKQSYGIFSPQYETDAYKNRNAFFSFDDPNTLLKFLGERARITRKRSTLGKRVSKKESKVQRSVAKVIKTARALSLLPYQED